MEPTTPPRRFAVLIDADNVSASALTGLLAEVANYGVAMVKRIYGDWTLPNLKSWKEQLLEHAIQPIQQFRYTVGKNATDSALIIDAMDLLYRGEARRLLPGLQRQRLHPPGVAHPRGRPDGDRLRRTQDAARVRHRLRPLRVHRHPARRRPRGRGNEAEEDRRPSSSSTASWSTCCAGPSKPARTTTAGPTSARSAPSSCRSSRTSIRAAMATPSSAAWSRRPGVFEIERQTSQGGRVDILLRELPPPAPARGRRR
jgi:hypothetical protein